MKSENRESAALEFAIRFVKQKQIPRFTRFLDPAEADDARQSASANGVDFAQWGGYPNAERTIGCFFPRGMKIPEEDYPLSCLVSGLDQRFDSITHRDVLGAFMALGLTRACLGDIIINHGSLYMFVESQAEGYVLSSMTSAGRTKLDFRVWNAGLQIPDPEGKYYRATIASLRLDVVLASAFGLSRTEAANMIRAGYVKVDHRVCDRMDHALDAGAMLSLQRKGRVKLVSIDGMTKKDRIGVTFFKFQ